MELKQVNNLIQRLKDDTISAFEKKALLDWYRKVADGAAEYPEDEESVHLRMLMRLNKEIRPSRTRSMLLRIAAVAAMLAIFFTFYMAWQVLRKPSPTAQFASLYVPKNQKKQITLADGTMVWLNAGSELKYSRVFSGKTREIYLSGEAFFDVHHDAAKPFIIHTGEVTTTVLGTAFNIKEDAFLHSVIVTVTRGKVSVANKGRQIGVLTPNQQLSFNMVSDKVSQQPVDANQVISWSKIDLHFEDVTFSDAAKQLEQRFDVKISFSNDKIKGCRFTGDSFTGEKLDKVLKAICDFNNATYRIQPDGTILIDGPGCN
jgi:ferric-dicitrate binding protein FerR (iron transport regulator)